MKSQHRHELETNWLAQRVGVWLDKIQPYNSLIVTVIVGVAVLFFGFSYYSGASSARQSEAWNTYNQAVEGSMPDLETLRESAQDYPDSPMQQWADITWADGQVWMASRFYIQNRAAAIDALNRAASAYQGLLRESEDPQLTGRAHFGLGRTYELRNELDKAREEYLAVTGALAELAEQRAKDLETSNAQETYDWLATAEGPRRVAPTGPGTPGQRPDFAPGELEIPERGAAETFPSIDDLFKGIGDEGASGDVTDRYETPDAASDESADSTADSAATETPSAADTPADDTADEPNE